MPETPALLYERELRLAVVMYGGVSLAIYMNGATQELLNLVRATAPDPSSPGRARHSDDELKNSSALVYRQLARLAGSVAGRAADPADPLGPVRQRFVVDILSGTSAGGINAVFLAKALANGQSLDTLAGLWQSEADIGLLINDPESLVRVPNLPRNRKPRSLLNSQRMYRKLLDAFDGMEGTASGAALVEEVDLFVTATDLEGLPVRLQLGGGEVAEERQYRKRFHLAFNSFDAGHNDFTREDNPFLAFVSRCTSSFPVAFEPTQFEEAAALLRAMRRPLPGQTPAGAGEADGKIPERWARHFAEYGDAGQGLEAPPARPFADGGYLDNKPFSYAIDAIRERRGGDSGRVERKLIYIEPDPERLALRPSQDTAQPPNAVENALAVIRLRSYETIREELLRLRDRNRLVDAIRSVVAGVDYDFQALGDSARQALATIISKRDEFEERALEQVVKVFGSAYGGYHRLKVGQLTDDLSQIVAAHAGISAASDEFRAVRLLVRAWRNQRYSPNPGAAAPSAAGPAPRRKESEFKLLTRFDLSFRIRRLSFVIDQINRYRVLTPAELAQELGQHPAICGGPAAAAIAAERPDELGNSFDELRRGLSEVVRGLRAERDRLLSPGRAGRLPAVAAGAADVRKAAGVVMAQPTDLKRREKVAKTILPGAGNALDLALSAMQAEVQARVEAASETARRAAQQLLQTDSRPSSPSGVLRTAEDVARFIGRHYYTWYELYDSMVFPILHGSEVGEEIAPVEAIRISPLTGRDQSGLAFGNPRLMPSGAAVGHFGAFLNAQWRARDILIGRMNAAEKLIRTILAGTPHDDPDRIATFVTRAHRAIVEEECGRAGSLVGAWLASVYNVNTPETRLQHVAEEGLPIEPLSGENVAHWIARSAKVMGRVFREASERPMVKRAAAVLLYSGHMLAGMVEVLVPRQWWGLVLRLWIPRLLVFALALILLGPLLGKEQVTGLGWTTFWLVLLFCALTLALRAVIQKRWSWLLRAGTALVALAVVGLLVIGVLYAPEALQGLWGRVARLWKG